MARSVSLSDPAFAALRHEKKPGESDSDVLLRLVREAHGRRRDPWRFYRARGDLAFTGEEGQGIAEKMRAADRRDPWDG